MLKRSIPFIMVLLLVTPFVAAQESNESGLFWWNDTVWYEIFVRSFYDSDGDGIGDFRGMTEKLDYLNDGNPETTSDLGITGIWLMPVTEAASYHGYDTVDYFSVESDYGTAEDFKAFMAAAHERGIRVIVDFVANHTSSKHDWFTQSAIGNSEYADWYVWADENPNYAGPWGATAWYEQGGRYYYAPFWSEMPDLNYKNPEVTATIFDAAEYWLTELDVDGFRLDAIKFVVEDTVNDVLLLQNAPANRQWLADFNAHIKSVKNDAVTVGEVWDATIAIQRYVEDASVDIAFEFDLAEDIINAARTGRKNDVERQLNNVMRGYPFGQFSPFLTNHDQPRLMTILNGDVAQNKVAAAILLTIPGSPFLYYGEEIGMMGSKPDELIRTPFPWDATPDTGGFTTGTPWQALNEGYETANVATQLDDPDSLLSYYRSLIHLRNDHVALRQGAVLPLKSRPNSIFAFLRYTPDETLLVIHNLKDEAISEYTLGLNKSDFAGFTSAEVVFGTGDVTAPTLDAEGGFEDYVPLPELAPQSLTVIRLN